jgi:lipoyl(octanoyl) transferase
VSTIDVRDLGFRPYRPVWEEMKRYTEHRDKSTGDQIWFVEHPPIYTLGLNADRAHVLDPRDIECLQIDRGGQVTYHGPGQLVCYVLMSMKRFASVRALVQALENAVIDTVARYGIEAYARRDAPGVYVGGRKLAAIGLRIRRGCTYHGLALNVEMDLEPFGRIRPCGLEGVEVTQVADLSGVSDLAVVRADLEASLLAGLGGRTPERAGLHAGSR